MRAVLYSLLLTSALCFAQSAAVSQGQEFFANGMNALRGSSTTRDNLRALDYFRRADHEGYAPAQTVLGYLEETGTIVPREPQQAATHYAKAAEQNDRLAQWALGKLYFTGEAGPRDLSRAEQWLTRAAEQGDPFGAYLLGLVNLERQDYAAAADHFRGAAEQGLPQAQQQLALLLKDGKGVRQDKAEAYMWLLLSLQGGRGRHTTPVGSSGLNPDYLLSELEAALGSAAVESAKSKARQLETTVSRSRNANGCTGWKGEFRVIPTTPPPDFQQFCR